MEPEGRGDSQGARGVANTEQSPAPTGTSSSFSFREEPKLSTHGHFLQASDVPVCPESLQAAHALCRWWPPPPLPGPAQATSRLTGLPGPIAMFPRSSPPAQASRAASLTCAGGRTTGSSAACPRPSLTPPGEPARRLTGAHSSRPPCSAAPSPLWPSTARKTLPVFGPSGDVLPPLPSSLLIFPRKGVC